MRPGGCVGCGCAAVSRSASGCSSRRPAATSGCCCGTGSEPPPLPESPPDDWRADLDDSITVERLGEPHPMFCTALVRAYTAAAETMAEALAQFEAEGGPPPAGAMIKQAVEARCRFTQLAMAWLKRAEDWERTTKAARAANP